MAAKKIAVCGFSRSEYTAVKNGFPNYEVVWFEEGLFAGFDGSDYYAAIIDAESLLSEDFYDEDEGYYTDTLYLNFRLPYEKTFVILGDAKLDCIGGGEKLNGGLYHTEKDLAEFLEKIKQVNVYDKRIKKKNRRRKDV